MARIIRFPLKMKNGAEIRTLDELKENFDLESVLGYFTDGKLTTWLADRYYDEKAAAVSALSADMPDLNAKLCEILEVEYKAEVDITNIDKIQRNNEKYKILCTITSDREILDNTDIVAMNQDDLYDILDEDTEKIYLYSEKFEIPFGRKSICYIGINNPLVIIDKTKFADDFDEAGIKFKNVIFEEGAFEYRYPDPVGEFEIEDGVLKRGIPNSEGVCVIPDGITSIGDAAFRYCHSLTSVTIPNSVTSIGELAFFECDELTTIKISNSVTSISYKTFGCCRNLTTITIPNSVTQITDFAFMGCKSLTTITIPDSVTQIGAFAFVSCKSLTTITIPDSVTSIGSGAFSGCSNLINVSININEISEIDIDTSGLSDTPWGKQNGYYREPPRKKKSVWDIFG